MSNLQEMLLQAHGERILLLPAWPPEYDIHFKLHAPRQTVVELHYRDGIVQKLEVFPPERTKDVVLFSLENTGDVASVF